MRWFLLCCAFVLLVQLTTGQDNQEKDNVASAAATGTESSVTATMAATASSSEAPPAPAGESGPPTRPTPKDSGSTTMPPVVHHPARLNATEPAGATKKENGKGAAPGVFAGPLTVVASLAMLLSLMRGL